jgi:hypothetical protein
MDTQSQEIKDLAAALAKAQAKIKPAKKDVENSFFKSKYADLAAVHEACIDALTAEGLSVTQSVVTVPETKGLLLITTLLHVSGQWLKSYMPITPVKNDPQGIGSAITYMRRYTLAALVGVATEDDVGNEASGKNTKEEKQKKSFDMSYDEEQNKESYNQVLKTIAGFGEVEKLNDWWKKEANKLKKLPPALYDDIVEAATIKKNEITTKTNGAYHGV